jgi:hypothetical protein
MRVLIEKPNTRAHLREQHVDGRAILKWMLQIRIYGCGWVQNNIRFQVLTNAKNIFVP